MLVDVHTGSAAWRIEAGPPRAVPVEGCVVVRVEVETGNVRLRRRPRALPLEHHQAANAAQVAKVDGALGLGERGTIPQVLSEFSDLTRFEISGARFFLVCCRCGKVVSHSANVRTSGRDD